MEFFTVLATFGLWFWLLATAVIIAAIISVENEKFVVTTPIVVAGVAGLVYLSHVDVIGWVTANLGTVATAFGAYLVAGVVYGVIRYIFFVHKIADRLAEWANQYGYNPKQLTRQQARDFASYAGVRQFPIKVADSKKRITFWMIYWPFSAPWTLVNEPVKRFFNFAYGRVAGLLQGISDRVFSDVEIVDDPQPETKKKPLMG